MILKPRTIFRKITPLFTLLLLSCIFYIEASMAGDATPDATYELKNALKKNLVKKGVCKHVNNCAPMAHRGSSRIYLNLYDQTNTALPSHIVAFYIEEALKVSEGIPVTFSAYPKPHEDYMNTIKYSFRNNDYVVRLKINKGKNHAD